MLLIGFPAEAFATNCLVIAPAEGEQCIVVDPGVGVVDRLSEVLRSHRLKPAAVLLTHGHLDHTYSVTPVCTSGDDEPLSAYIHEDDSHRLADPLAATDPGLLAMLSSQFGSRPTWREPDDVVTFRDKERLHVAGLTLDILHAPGHTEGSAMFQLPGVPEQIPVDSGLTSTLLAGDVLFAGGIGRTDLAGGSDSAMRATLRDVVLSRADATLVFPGHGPATTIGRERTTNPYLQREYLDEPRLQGSAW